MNLRSDFTTIKSSDIFTNCRGWQGVPRLCTPTIINIKIGCSDKNQNPLIFTLAIWQKGGRLKKKNINLSLQKIAIKDSLRFSITCSFMDGVPAQSNKTRDINKPERTEH